MEISQIVTVTGQIMAVYTAIKVLQYKQRPSFPPCLCTAIRALLAKDPASVPVQNTHGKFLGIRMISHLIAGPHLSV